MLAWTLKGHDVCLVAFRKDIMMYVKSNSSAMKFSKIEEMWILVFFFNLKKKKLVLLYQKI